jgi:hypothetical protein
MPIKKKSVEMPVAAESPAPRPRKASTRTKKAESPSLGAEAAPELKARRKPAAGVPAATHKVPVRKAVARKSPSKPAPFDVEAHRAEIEREAYFLWLGRGCSHGSAGEDWVKAVEIVMARMG